MLHKFLTSNHTKLIARCKDKAAKRFAPSWTPAPVDHGVPLFLQQLVDTLRLELAAYSIFLLSQPITRFIEEDPCRPKPTLSWRC